MSVVQFEQRLVELRDRANEEHRLTQAAAANMIEHAIAAGQALNEVREIVPWGEWMAWVEAEFEGSLSNANFYRRVALNAEFVRESGSRTLREAERWLTEHADLTASIPRTGEIVQRRRQEIVRLRKTGKSAEEIAQVVGVSRSTVYSLSRKDWKRLHRQRNSRSKKAMQALRRAERDRLAKRVGGDAAEAYAMIRRTAQVIERASEKASSKEERQHLGRALDRLYRAEDEISRALRLAGAGS